MPALNFSMSSGLLPLEKFIRKGILCSTFTKFPAELSWGMSEKLAPVALDMDFTIPLKITFGMASTFISTFWPSCILAV